MKKGKMIARLFLGLIFVVFGLNGFLNFLPMPEMTPEAGALAGALAASGYFFPFLKLVEVVCGALLLANRYVPLALTVLAPIVVNIFLFHAFLDLAGMPIGVVLILLEMYLACAYWDNFKSVLKSKVS